MLHNHSILLAIEEKINEIGLEYAQVQGSILTEDDLKCILFSKLSGLGRFRNAETTKDSLIKASKVHAELSWFDNNGKLTIKPDLTILEPGNLSITKSVQRSFPLPSKGFHMKGDAIIFELKFIRNRNGIS